MNRRPSDAGPLMDATAGRATVARNDVVMAFPGVGWRGLQHAKKLLGESPTRITYADGDLSLMSPGVTHESYVDALRDLVKAVTRAFRIPTRSLGSTLWERREADSGKMPDAAFYVGSVARIGDRMPDAETDPVPDLVVEVEITNPVNLALRAYANMGVPEVWHFARRPRRAAALRFLRLEEGRWVAVAASPALPMLESASVLPLVERAALMNDLDRADLFDAWIRDELRAPRA